MHFSTVGDFSRALIDVLLERHDLAAPPAAVGRDDEPGLGVVVAVGDGLGAEAAEDDAVGGADAGAGQHGDRHLRDHRHVDRDAVAWLDALAFQHVGELADLAVQHLVREHAAVARLAFPDDGGLVAARPVQVAIEAVGAGVELAADEPLGVRLVPDQHLVPVLEPVERFGLLGPEALGIVLGALPELFVLGQALDVGLGGELRRRRKGAGFLEDAGDVAVGGRGHGRASSSASATGRRRTDISAAGAGVKEKGVLTPECERRSQ